MNKLEIHIRLKIARKELQLNQIEIAKDLSIQQKTISEIENGKILNIPNTYIYYFYKKGVSLEWLYDNKGTMMAKDKSLTKDAEGGQIQLDMLFEQMQNKTIINTDQNTDIDSSVKPFQNQPLYERLIDAKDLTISSLLAFMKTQENNLEFLKALLNKVEK